MFDAYAQFEELALSKKMEEIAESESPGDEDEVEVELRMSRWDTVNILGVYIFVKSIPLPLDSF